VIQSDVSTSLKASHVKEKERMTSGNEKEKKFFTKKKLLRSQKTDISSAHPSKYLGRKRVEEESDAIGEKEKIRENREKRGMLGAPKEQE